MKLFKLNYLLLAATLSISTFSNAQEEKDTLKVPLDGEKGNGYNLTLGTNGVRIGNKNYKSKNTKSRIQTYWGMLDLGLNFIHDQSVYGAGNSLSEKYGLDGDWFDLRNGRSWNVNIYPVMVNYKAINNKNFRFNVYSGVGLQIYNFRYKTSITHQTEPRDGFTNDVNFKYSKNKLSQNFLTVPLMVNFNHKVDKSNWFTYGFGASVGYNLNTWTKQQSSQFGKVKNHDLYNFNEFNVNVIGEIGIGNIRFFGSYQVTNMYKNVPLKQNPVSFGIRLDHI